MKISNYIYRIEFLLFLYLLGYFNLVEGSSLKVEKEKIASSLISNGYENIKVIENENRILLAYENRVHRFEVDAILEVIKIVVPLINEGEELVLIPLNRKIPVIKISAKLSDCREYIQGKINNAGFAQVIDTDFDIDEEAKLMSKETEYNSSNFNFDLVLKPHVEIVFGPFENPVQPLLAIAPDIRVGIWKGMQLSYEVIIPFYNEFGPRDDSVHTGLATFSQTLRFPKNLFVSTSFGIFTNNRYGFDFEARKYFLNGDLNFGIDYGLTSYISFSGFNRIFYYDKFIWTGYLDCIYRIQKYDLTLRTMIGKFLLGDNTFRFEINREFGEIEIGFFAMRSFDGVSNGGFRISIPLWPSKYFDPEFFRVRVAENYSFSYIVKSNPLDLIGDTYSTFNSINSFMKKLNPGFIKNILKKNIENQ